MLKLHLARSTGAEYQILCLGSHCDDIEIGCGGTIMRLLQQFNNCAVHWIVLSSNQKRAEEARRSADTFLANAKTKDVIIEKFQDGFFPYNGGEIKQYFEQLKHKLSPDVIFTHCRQDLHQDHRVLCELTWNTWRDHLIYEYEVPKYDGDLGSPNFFVELDEATSRRKAQTIVETFGSQDDKHWFSEETFLALMRLRGMECRASTKYAEAFHARKLVLGDC